jgi:hypothetical protein
VRCSAFEAGVHPSSSQPAWEQLRAKAPRGWLCAGVVWLAGGRREEEYDGGIHTASAARIPGCTPIKIAEVIGRIGVRSGSAGHGWRARAHALVPWCGQWRASRAARRAFPCRRAQHGLLCSHLSRELAVSPRPRPRRRGEASSRDTCAVRLCRCRCRCMIEHRRREEARPVVAGPATLAVRGGGIRNWFRGVPSPSPRGPPRIYSGYNG